MNLLTNTSGKSDKAFRRDNCRRKHGHDYCAPWKYHITITKATGCDDFSNLIIRELHPGGVTLDYSPLGLLIWMAIRDLPRQYIKILQYAIMPDHIHLLIQVIERLPRHLGFFIAAFKTQVANEWRIRKDNRELEVFTENYNDRLILPEHSLDDVFKYVKHNPYRLAVRRERPDFFQKKRGIYIDGREVQAYGNLFLLRNPFKLALVVHRADSEEVIAKKIEDCLYFAENGGVVVSAFISEKEKEIRQLVEAACGRIILVHDRPLGPKQKPARHNFNLCSDGQLLLISPIDYTGLPFREHPSRNQCLDMNALAEKIAYQSYPE